MDLMKFVMKYKLTIIITLVALIIFILALLLIKKFIYPRASRVEGYSGNEVNVIMFHVDWCPYCKSALPVWRKLTENYNGVTMNRKKVNIISLDATDENSTSEDFGGNSIEEIMSSFKIDGTPYTIEGYPTIVIADKDNNVLAEFEKTSTYENLENFINDNMRI